MCGFGIAILFNVRDIIRPNNKKIVKGTLFLASRNQFLPVGPLLFFMATSSHFVFFGKGSAGRIGNGTSGENKKGAALRLRYVHF